MQQTISIITINYNNAGGLERTLNSVFNQTHLPAELIIIDGGSTDESVNIIKGYPDKIAYWVSEPDKGIYAAQNKGLARAGSDYVLFLNSGDTLLNEDILQNVSLYLGNADIIYGDLQIKETTKSWVKKYNEKITFGYFLGDTLPHQGSFIRRSIFDKTGFLDETLEICSDWKFFLEAVCRFNASTYYLDFVVSEYDFTGISSNEENSNKIDCEKQSVLKKEFPKFYEEYLELFELRIKYPPLAKSRFVKAYLKIRKLFAKKKDIGVPAYSGDLPD